jgi:hypothetical protein
MSRTSTAAKRGVMHLIGVLVKVPVALGIRFAIAFGPPAVLAWFGLVAMTATAPIIGIVAAAVGLTLATATVSARRVKADLDDVADAKRLAAASDAAAVQAGITVLGVRDPLLNLAIKKGFRSGSDAADRTSAWLTPFLALTAIGLASTWTWAITLVLVPLAIWTLNRRSAASQRIDLKPSMFKHAPWLKVAAAGVAAGAGWVGWVWVLVHGGALLAAHTTWLVLPRVAAEMQLAVVDAFPAAAAGLIAAGWVTGALVAAEQVRLVREKHLLAGDLASWLGITDKLLGELHWEVRDHSEIVVHGPLPAAALINEANLTTRLAAASADWQMAEASSSRIRLVALSPETQADRELLAETGGLVTAIRQVDDTYPDPDPSDVFVLTMEDL